MKDILILESVRERDIDLLLIEEFCVNKEFTNFFLSKLFGKQFSVSQSIAYHSIMDSSLGESDIVLSYIENNKHQLLLIENKIDAIAQVEQALRYAKRSEKLSKKFNCNVDICIVAPKNYLENNLEAKKYQMQLSYEDIQQYFIKKDTLRNEYKAKIMQLALDQERRGYIAVKDELVTKFWHEYWKLLRQKIPSAIMNEPLSIPSNSDWAMIKFDFFPKKCFIYHKFKKGYIDLQTNFSEEQVRKIYENYHNSKMKIVRTGKSYAIRIEVKPINKHLEISKQLNHVDEAFKVIKMFNINKQTRAHQTKSSPFDIP